MPTQENILNIIKAVSSTSIVNIEALFPADGRSNSIYRLEIAAYAQGFNSVTWDRFRNNNDITVLTSAARTSSSQSSDLTNYNHRGVRLFLNITVVSGTTPTLDVKVQTKDSVSSGYFDLPGAAFAQKTTVTSDDLTIYPGIAETADETVSDVLGRTWRVVYTITGTTPSFTFSVGAEMIL